MFQRLYELGQTIAEMDSRQELHELLRDPIAEEYQNLVEIVFSEDGANLKTSKQGNCPQSNLKRCCIKKVPRTAGILRLFQSLQKYHRRQ